MSSESRESRLVQEVEDAVIRRPHSSDSGGDDGRESHLPDVILNSSAPPSAATVAPAPAQTTGTSSSAISNTENTDNNEPKEYGVSRIVAKNLHLGQLVYQIDWDRKGYYNAADEDRLTEKQKAGKEAVPVDEQWQPFENLMPQSQEAVERFHKYRGKRPLTFGDNMQELAQHQRDVYQNALNQLRTTEHMIVGVAQIYEVGEFHKNSEPVYQLDFSNHVTMTIPKSKVTELSPENQERFLKLMNMVEARAPNEAP